MLGGRGHTSEYAFFPVLGAIQSDEDLFLKGFKELEDCIEAGIVVPPEVLEQPADEFLRHLRARQGDGAPE